MAKVSVIIPAYNAMKYLPETLTSVTTQTFSDFEIIIVNDGSSDGIEDYISQTTDARVKIISQENKGLAAARNAGITNAQGEYIAFLDADDIWEPTKLEQQVSALEKHPEIGLVYTWVAYIDEKGASTGRVFKHHAEGDVWQQLVEHNIVECGSVPMVRRSCFDTVGIFDWNLSRYNVHEDWDMWLRIAARYPFKVVKETLVYYRQVSSSASKKWQAVEESALIVIEKAFKSAPPELLYLKQRSYSFANIHFAWKALQSRDKDYKKAIHFRSQALINYPWVCLSQEFLRLTLAITLMQWLGAESYQRLLMIFHALRRRLVAIE
ncbi:MAG: glycosyltransferase family 2 protein [Desmonostoc vinosum HA7617-LM4]|nr:glycosyltransferase family 2 protein [Desmonostoc vinosum HA7617-LM4]